MGGSVGDMPGAPQSGAQAAPARPPARPSAVSFGSRTDVGYVRDHNEDSLLVAPPLFVVCDGMGGHEGGEVASEIAIQTIAARAPKGLEVEVLGHAVEEANLAIIDAAAAGVGKEGMGTTCTAAILENDRLAIAHVGDSRAYLLHNGALQQITRDHSVVADLVESGEISPEEARTHQWRSYITRALGLDPYMTADLYELSVGAGDRLMLCSDGLYSMVTDDVIGRILRDVADPQACADALVEAALAGGGADNVTVIVTDAVDAERKRISASVKRARATVALIVVLMVAIIIGAIAGFSAWVSNSAYLGDVDGKVAIYRGVPGEVLGMGFAQLEEVTDVPLDDLLPGVAARITNDDVRCDSVDAARELVNGYRRDAEARAADESQVPAQQAQDGQAAEGAGVTAATAQPDPATSAPQPDPAGQPAPTAPQPAGPEGSE